jgi:hypothetical protein
MLTCFCLILDLVKQTFLSFFLVFWQFFFQCMTAQQQHRWAAAGKNETIQKEKKKF